MKSSRTYFHQLRKNGLHTSLLPAEDRNSVGKLAHLDLPLLDPLLDRGPASHTALPGSNSRVTLFDGDTLGHEAGSIEHIVRQQGKVGESAMVSDHPGEIVEISRGRDDVGHLTKEKGEIEGRSKSYIPLAIFEMVLEHAHDAQDLILVAADG